MGGFGGSNKNLGIGCADGKIGKKMIHAGETGSQWGITVKGIKGTWRPDGN